MNMLARTKPRNSILKSHHVQVAQLPFVIEINAETPWSGEQPESLLLECESTPQEPDVLAETVQDEVDMLLRAAEQEAAEIKRAAHVEGVEAGRAQGYQEGYAQGRAAGETEARETLEAARRLVGEIRRWRSEMILNSEATVMELVTEVAGKLFGAGFTLSPEQLHAAVSQALDHAKTLTNLKIHLHPGDAARLQPLWNSEEIALLSDEEIEPGGCLIVGDEGEVNARLPVQLAPITETLSAAAQAV